MLFYPFDYETYINGNRGLKFEYKKMTPGGICLNLDELIKEITCIIDNVHQYHEKFAYKQSEILNRFNCCADGESSYRLYREVCELIKVV